MITILLHLVLVLIVLGLFYWLATLIPLPPPFPRIIQVVFVIIAVLYLLSVLLPLAGMGFGGSGHCLNC